MTSGVADFKRKKKICLLYFIQEKTNQHRVCTTKLGDFTREMKRKRDYPTEEEEGHHPISYIIQIVIHVHII